MSIEKMWNAFHYDYPDIAGPVLRRIQSQHRGHEAEMHKAHARVFQELMDGLYPDWQQVRDSPQFKRWLHADPARIAEAQVPGVKNALKLLGEFDTDHGRGRRLSAGGDEYFADIADRQPPVRQPGGIDPFRGFASLADILPTARPRVH